MRRFAFSFLAATTLMAQFASAQMPACNPSVKPLFRDIQIFNETENLKPNHGIIGDRLRLDLDLMKSVNLTTKEKIHSLETGFVKCDLALSGEEQMLLEQAIDQAKALILQR